MRRKSIRLLTAAVMASLASCAQAEEPKVSGPMPDTFVYRGAGCKGRDRMAAFEKLTERPVAGVAEFTEIGDWSRMTASVDWAQGCWAQRRGLRISQSVPMLMQPGSGTTLAEGARGAYDRHFYDLGKLLVARGKADAYLRIGWEFNGDWYTWAAAPDPATWKAYFRRIVKVMRSVPGQHFRIVWNPAQGEQKIAPDKVWPGDDVVDVVGYDIYNQSWRPQDRFLPGARWNNLKAMPYGLDWVASFARAHGKPIAVPEWGTGTRPDGHGGGDDPLFVSNMARWMRANRVLYHVYWDYDAGDFNGELSNGRQPKAAAAFRQAFGGGQEPKRP